MTPIPCISPIVLRELAMICEQNQKMADRALELAGECGRLCTVEQLVHDDPAADVRRAICRAAAEIGQPS